MAKHTTAFSLESLTDSIYGSKTVSRSKESAKIFAQNGVTPILFESCEDAGVYATAAMESYKDGAHFSNYADLSFESLAHDVKLIRAIKAKSGENFSFSLEADGGIDAKKMIQKAVFAVKAGIQKFIIAIGNFIKSIANWIGSAAVNGQDKMYTDALGKGLIAAALKSNLKMNVVKPVAGRDVLFNPAKFAELDSLADIVARTDPKNDAALPALYKQVQAALNKLVSNGAAGPGVGENFKVPSGSAFAKQMIYGSNESAEITVAQLATAKDYTILTKANAQAFSKSINTAKKSSAAMAKTLKLADSVMASVGNVSTSGDDKDVGKKEMRNLMLQKNIHGFNVSFLLSYYGYYLKERAILARALHMVAGGEKKAAAAAPAAK
jgi:hypothetical protein